MVDFKMVGRDLNSSPTQYRTWVVSDAPDLDGYYYSGLKSGDSPLIDITAYNLSGYDGYPADFNLPDPLNWKTTRKILPAAISNSQLAVVDGYVYLFGGEKTDVIYRATLDNPADWTDTGEKLPTTLWESSLEILDGYLYLIGGTSDYNAVNTVFKASVTDPLTWTNEGACLPKNIRQAQSAIIDGYIYLYGGKEFSLTTNSILRAPTSNPLLWTDSGSQLPYDLYNSKIAFMDGYAHLLGGQTVSGYYSSNILRANLNDPLTWTVYGTLPYACAGAEFATVGDKGYLFATCNINTLLPYKTSILRCSLSDPSVWVDTDKTVPGTILQSQLAIIYDRLFLFGGSGSSVIFACEQRLKYVLGGTSESFYYGDVTRTQLNDISDPQEKTYLLGIPYWKTDYGP